MERMETDCDRCQGEGCPVCDPQPGWLEVGQIHTLLSQREYWQDYRGRRRMFTDPEDVDDRYLVNLVRFVERRLPNLCLAAAWALGIDGEINTEQGERALVELHHWAMTPRDVPLMQALWVELEKRGLD